MRASFYQVPAVVMMLWPRLSSAQQTAAYESQAPDKPVLTAFSPSQGAVGQRLTLTGSRFIGVTAVAVANTPVAKFRVVSATTIEAVVPKGATSGPITVTTRTGTATSAGAFQVAGASAGAFSARVVEQARAQQPNSAQAQAWLNDLQATMDTAVDVRTVVAGWVANGLDEQRLSTFFQSATDKKLVFKRLGNATKGLYQQRVVIDDYANIPGVAKAAYVPNGLPYQAIQALAFDVKNPAFDLPAERAITFTKEAKLVEIKPGQKLYRVTNEASYDMTGRFWTRTPPATLADVVGGTAVMPEWNNFRRVYEFTAPPYTDSLKTGPRFYVWEGPAAAQAVSGIYRASGESLQRPHQAPSAK